MGNVLDLSVLWTVVTDIFRAHNERNNNTIDALGSVRRAFNYTHDYLINKNGEYIPNMELADLWNDASTAVMRVDRNLGEMLGRKSRFWAHPDIYFELNNAENILAINQITDEMERLFLRIR